MSQPQFTAMEQFMVGYYKSVGRTVQMGPLLFDGFVAALFAYGLYRADSALMFGAFATSIGCRMFQTWRGRDNSMAMRSAIEKYEHRIEDLSRPPSA